MALRPNPYIRERTIREAAIPDFIELDGIPVRIDGPLRWTPTIRVTVHARLHPSGLRALSKACADLAEAMELHRGETP